MEKRYCLYCKKELVKHKKVDPTARKGFRMEFPYSFNLRKFCGQSCSEAFARTPKVEKTPQPVFGYRRTKEDLAVLERDGFHCKVCGQQPSELVIYTNSKADTRETLCYKCLMVVKVLPFVVNQGHAKEERNKVLIEDYKKMPMKDVAKKHGISHQAVSLIIRNAEKKGQVDFSELKKQRHQEAMLIANSHNPLKNIDTV